MKNKKEMDEKFYAEVYAASHTINITHNGLWINRKPPVSFEEWAGKLPFLKRWKACKVLRQIQREHREKGAARLPKEDLVYEICGYSPI